LSLVNRFAMNKNDVETLYAYNRWANLRMFSTVEKLSDEKLSATMQSSFPSIEESVLHILAAEWIWLRRWTGQSPRAGSSVGNASSRMRSAMVNGGVPLEMLKGSHGLRSFADSLEQERQAFLRALDEGRLHSTLDFSDLAGTRYSAPLVELLQHVVNHGTYHRGQVTTLLRQAGADTISLDMLFFFRERQEVAARASN
jgi:uncharacterized damage-inducible protein DinB